MCVCNQMIQRMILHFDSKRHWVAMKRLNIEFK